MGQSNIVFVATNDFSGLTRGRGIVPARDQEFEVKGIGWVPANQAITPFDTIGPNPFGSHGDLRIIPDMETEVSYPGEFGEIRFVLGDIKSANGKPWSCCPRSILQTAIKDLELETGLTLSASFEHEFALLTSAMAMAKSAAAFTLEAYAEAQEFSVKVIEALENAGVEPELFLPEFGAAQFEIPVAPADALKAADRAVIFREIVRVVARSLDKKATFAPKVDMDSVGNGAHIHFSLRDKNGQPVNYDPDCAGDVSAVMGAFCAGIMRHITGLTAIVAPSVASYYRLQPHSWSNAYTCMGLQNREASLRICPAPTPLHSPATSHHLEFRTGDSTASPYLALAGLIRTGLDGIRNNLPQPPLVNSDPDALSDADKKKYNVKKLPSDLNAALAELYMDDELKNGFGQPFIACYRSMKEAEIGYLDHKDAAQICQLYTAVY